jgi:hypothetical protein
MINDDCSQEQPPWSFRMEALKEYSTKVVQERKNIVNNLHMMKSNRTKGTIFQFGIRVPRNTKEAYELDKKNSNTNWEDAMKDEVSSLFAFNNFEEHGKILFLEGYKNNIIHFVFAINDDRDTRLV